MAKPHLLIWILFVLGVLLLPLIFLTYALANANGVPEGPTYALDAVQIALDDPALEWSDGWTVTRDGATPPEPADPMTMPAGTLRFTYQGKSLSLRIMPGDYWAYLYATVDGEPANLLPSSRGHDPAPTPVAGYLPLYKPEPITDDYAQWGEWVPIHHSDDITATHEVELTFWRGWAETPLTGIKVDGLLNREGKEVAPILGVIALALMAPGLWVLGRKVALYPARNNYEVGIWSRAFLQRRNGRVLVIAGAGGFLLALAGVWLDQWLLCAVGLGLLGLTSLLRPEFWYAALFFALPFYYSFALPLLPGRSINLVDVGAWLGLLIASAHALLVVWSGKEERTSVGKWALLLLAALAAWAAISTAMSGNIAIATREWRTVFLAAVAIGAGLLLLFRFSANPQREVAWVVGGWLAGATLFAGLGLLLYPNEQVIIPAEGVQRLRGFYGSPNNLALYLERTLAVALALALFARAGRLRIAALIAALVQLAAFLLTFSKGGLFVALPAMGVALWGAGYLVLRKQGRSTRVLWALAGAALLVGIALIPFLDTERFASVIDFASGTGFLRVNLWQSAWQMALDHPLVGVGPDGFLYAYRSHYIFPQAWMEPNLNHPHNWLLDWWTRLGLPGLLLGLSFWGLLLWNLLQNLRRAGRFIAWDALQVGLFAATIAALAHGVVDLSYALPDLMAVWVLMAMIASVQSAETRVSK
jgi:O-antigen ligase